MTDPTNAMDVAAELDALWPGWNEAAPGSRHKVGGAIVERYLDGGWSVWRLYLWQHGKPRPDTAGYSAETSWSVNDYGLLHELEQQVGTGDVPLKVEPIKPEDWEKTNGR